MNISSTHGRGVSGRVAIVTGGARGLGFAIARELTAQDAVVTICSRNHDEISAAARLLPPEKALARTADVTRVEELNRLVEETLEHFGRVDILVNNAGIHGPKGLLEDIDIEEWMGALAVNLTGSVIACRAVLPHMKRQGYGRILQISGGGATKPMPRLSAYAASKAGVVRFVETLAAEVSDSGVTVNALAPGALNTRMLDDLLHAGKEAIGEALHAEALQQKATGGASLDTAARCAVFLVSEAAQKITGKLISAVWDPWESLLQHESDLDSDVYTLRRIVPRDRGLTWGDR